MDENFFILNSIAGAAALSVVVAGASYDVTNVGKWLLTGLGIELGGAVLQAGSSALKNLWLTSDNGALNHDIQLALFRAYQHALDEIQTKYFGTEEGKKLPKDQQQDIGVILKKLKNIPEKAFTRSMQSAVTDKDVEVILYADPDGTADLIWRRLDVEELELRYNNGFKTFFLTTIVKEIQFWFGEELKGEKPENVKAWRAFQRFLLEGLRADVSAIRVSQEGADKRLSEIKELALQKLEGISAKLDQFESSSGNRDPSEPFQKWLDQSVADIRKELNDQLNGLEKKLGVEFKVVVDEVRGQSTRISDELVGLTTEFRKLEERHFKVKSDGTLRPSDKDVYSAYSLGIAISTLMHDAENDSFVFYVDEHRHDITHFVEVFALNIFPQDQYPSIHLLIKQILEQGGSKLASELFIEVVTQLSNNHHPAINVAYAIGTTMPQLIGCSDKERAFSPSIPFFDVSFQLEFLSWYKTLLYKSLNVFPENFVDWYENILEKKNFERSVNKISTWFSGLVA